MYVLEFLAILVILVAGVVNLSVKFLIRRTMSAMVMLASEIEESASDGIGYGVVSKSNGFFPRRSAESNAVFSLSRHGSLKSDFNCGVEVSNDPKG